MIAGPPATPRAIPIGGTASRNPRCTSLWVRRQRRREVSRPSMFPLREETHSSWETDFFPGCNGNEKTPPGSDGRIPLAPSGREGGTQAPSLVSIAGVSSLVGTQQRAGIVLGSPEAVLRHCRRGSLNLVTRALLHWTGSCRWPWDWPSSCRLVSDTNRSRPLTT